MYVNMFSHVCDEYVEVLPSVTAYGVFTCLPALSLISDNQIPNSFQGSGLNPAYCWFVSTFGC